MIGNGHPSSSTLTTGWLAATPIGQSAKHPTTDQSASSHLVEGPLYSSPPGPGVMATATEKLRGCTASIADSARACAPSLSLAKVHLIAGSLQLVSAVTFLVIYFSQKTKPEATTSLYLHYTGWANVSEDTSCDVVKCRAVRPPRRADTGLRLCCASPEPPGRPR